VSLGKNRDLIFETELYGEAELGDLPAWQEIQERNPLERFSA